MRLTVCTHLREPAAQRWLAVAALVLPALGTVVLLHLPPLVVSGMDRLVVLERIVGQGDATPSC